MEQSEAFFGQSTGYQNIIDAFNRKGCYAIYGLSGSQRPFFLSLAERLEEKSTLIIVKDKEHKLLWQRDLEFLSPAKDVFYFPLVDKIHFETRAKSLENQIMQMQVLGKILDDKPIIVLATAEEAAQKIISPEDLHLNILSLTQGAEIKREIYLERLVALGYERVDQVEQRGHFSVRGDILDIFAINMEHPLRVEFFGDEIDTLRTFSTDTQRSFDYVEQAMILPITLKVPEESSLLDYLLPARIIVEETMRLQENLKGFLHERAEHEEYFFSWRELMSHAKSEQLLFLSFLQQKSLPVPPQETFGVTTKTMVSFERQLPILLDEIRQWLANDYAINIVVNNRQRSEILAGALQKEGMPFSYSDTLLALKGEVVLVRGLITDGFELPGGHYIVISEGNIFGRQKKKLRKKVEKGREINYFTDLHVGDYVVHSTHGIGKYVGLRNIESEGIHKDYLEIDYAGTDRLFLSTDNLDQLQKYIGNEGETPRLHRMGGAEWQRTKKRAQQSIDDLAEKLTALYAKRSTIEGFAFLPDEPWQEEFEAAFPYEETEDQLRAVAEIKASMEQLRPMDRLLCGDVGFGKTEVAMRAAFKAVMSGKQVAVLVPTTILAQQHYQKFVERFTPFGIRVDVINRFRSAKERAEALSLARLGQCNILIGTHALLSKKVQFKDLGLLIVDEEQRFGVGQKETWKAWASNIDVLTLSATPIPRTLHMSLVGVREMSVIHTPPEERLPVQTYVIEYDMEIIVDAIRRELRRGGQVYFVYNRVASIQHMAELLKTAMPDLNYAIAHGQMSGAQIESVMVDFYEGNYDLLLCTSIVENGLDVPNANTILIYDADHLGLSQLYQMRGRVGRSGRRAYAYFMYRPDKVLTEAAEKRLQAIKEFTELGAGFKLAMRDLEIRGAGTLLGSQQHGNISSVGFATYCMMLEEAIAKVQGESTEKEEQIDPSLDLQVDAFIDEAYVKDGGRKIALYQRLLQVKSMAELDDFTDELVDRFGTPTEPVEALLRMARIKERARLLGIKSMFIREALLHIHWQNDSLMSAWDMGAVTPKYWKLMKFLPTKPTSATVRWQEMKLPVLTAVEYILKELEKR